MHYQPVNLSIVVVLHDMAREAPRTLHALTPEYQRDLVDDRYEIIAIDNGSEPPLDFASMGDPGDRTRFHRHETESPSPAAAVNVGVAMARGKAVAVTVDGARVSSPGLVGLTQRALALADRPFVVALSWHLGPAVQNESMLDGYDQKAEDALLERIGWPEDGYRLFEVSTLAPSSQPGFRGGLPAECSWWALHRTDFMAVGGFDERFDSPGGGLVNHDFRNRVVSMQGVSPIVLVGEGVFHQFHGGVATNVPRKDHPMRHFKDEYHRVRGVPYSPAPAPEVQYLGSVPDEAHAFVAD